MKHVELYGMVLGIMSFLLVPFLLSPFPVFEALHYGPYRIMIFEKIMINIFLGGVFYLNVKILTPRLLEQRRAGEFIFVLTCLLICFLYLDSGLANYNRDAIHPPFMPYNTMRMSPPVAMPGTGPFTFLPQIVGNLVVFLLIVFSSSIIVLVSERIHERDLKQQILFEKIKAELSVLKLQVSPHFLFNTLNNIRYLARKKSDKTEEAIVELAQLLRYMIYQVNDDLVPLSKEIEYLKRYINLQKMRLPLHSKINFNISGNYSARKIEPLLFITFIENAFKYGVHSQKPSLLLVELAITDSDVVFYCENEIFYHDSASDSESFGTGIENVKRRLNLYYPNRHQLQIETKNGIYTVYLSLHFTHG